MRTCSHGKQFICIFLLGMSADPLLSSIYSDFLANTFCHISSPSDMFTACAVRINNEPPHSGEEAYYKELLNFRISHAKITTRYRKYRLPPAIFASATTFLIGVHIGCCTWLPGRKTAARFCGAIPTFSPAAVCWAPMAQMQQGNRRFGYLTTPPNKQFAKSGAIIRRRCIACMMKTLCLYNPQACGNLPLQAPSFLV